MEKIVFVSAVRTPIGKLGGALAPLTAVELGTIATRAALKRAQLAPDQVDELYFGSAIQAGQGQNVARQVALKSGMPNSTPAMTINVLCGSGMQAVSLAAKMIKLGEAETVVAGGTESMSNAPYLIPKGRTGYHFGNATMEDALVKDGLEDAFGHYQMGITAENLLEKDPVSRYDLDAFALRSQVLARAAEKAGRFTDEIVPVTVPERHGSRLVTNDEAIRDSSMDQLAKLPPVFKKGGRVTAGNSSGLNDGASALVLTTERHAKAAHLPILGYWEDGNLVGVDPAIMGIGPVAASKKLLDKHGLSVDQLDLIELNEAFAAQAVVSERQLGLDPDRVNVNGGAIALGHPLGDSGARILVTLLHELKRRGQHRGLATLCIGGGMGAATLVSR